MKDSKIIELYWERNEKAISETDEKYGKLCRKIAGNILANYEDGEECVYDTYFELWSNIPPKRPEKLAAFIGKVTRNIALKRYEYKSAEKRNPEAVCSIDELKDCVSGRKTNESEIESILIQDTISKFLWHQSKVKRDVFILRYWYFESVDSICQTTGFNRSKVKSMLYNMRHKLRIYLEKEGVEL